MDEKKKLMILGAMGVVLLGIGVVQFTKGSGAPAPAPAPAASAAKSDATANGDKKDDLTAPQQNDLVTGSYAQRDPFKPLVDPNASSATLVAQQTPPTKPLQTRVATGEAFPNYPIDKGGSLPQAGVAPGGGTTTPLTPPAPQFGYRLAGIIVGKKPAAVFVDAQGAQHLIELGGSLDGDTQLVDLDRDHVSLRVKGQIKTLTLGGGESSAK
jgi:hypothetical protein